MDTRILVPWRRGEYYFDPVRTEIGGDTVGWGGGGEMFLVEKRATQEDRKYLGSPVLIPFFFFFFFRPVFEN